MAPGLDKHRNRSHLESYQCQFQENIVFFWVCNGVQYSIILWYHNRCTYYMLNQFNIPTNFRENCHAFTLVTNPGISQQLKPRGGKSYFMFNGVSSPISLCPSHKRRPYALRCLRCIRMIPLYWLLHRDSQMGI